MKKLVLIFLITFSLDSFSQTSIYIPFPTVQGDWIYRYYDDFGNPTNGGSSYQLSGDTIIGDSMYKKIHSSGWLDTEGGYKGAIRELDKVIYYIPDTSTVEYVLYDFNLNEGDTIIHPLGGAVCSNDTVIVENIDSILIDNNYHKRFWFSSYSTWIEGIGSNYYLLQPYDVLCVSGNDLIECMMNDSVIIWGSSNSSCFVSVNEIEIPENDLSIYPNPSNSNYTITLQIGMIKEIWVIDSSGRKIISEKNINQPQITLDKLPVGAYILKLFDDRGRLSIRKLISSP